LRGRRERRQRGRGPGGLGGHGHHGLLDGDLGQRLRSGLPSPPQKPLISRGFYFRFARPNPESRNPFSTEDEKTGFCIR
jgi:hypothetical protein